MKRLALEVSSEYLPLLSPHRVSVMSIYLFVRMPSNRLGDIPPYKIVRLPLEMAYTPLQASEAFSCRSSFAYHSTYMHTVLCATSRYHKLDVCI